MRKQKSRRKLDAQFALEIIKLVTAMVTLLTALLNLLMESG